MKARIRHIMVAASVAALLGVSPARAINVTYKAVLVNGQAAPGLPGETLRVVSNPGLIPVAPVIDSAGQFIALAARESNLQAMLIAGNSRVQPPALRIVASIGDSALGLPAGVTISEFKPFVNIGAGRAIFGATLSGTGVTASNSEALLVESAVGESPRVLVRAGDPAPGVAGATVTSLNALEQWPSSSPSGVIGFVVFISSGAAIWRANVDIPAPPMPIAVRGQPVPGQSAGVTYSQIPQRVQVTDAGEVIAIVGLAGPGIVGDGAAIVAFAPGSTTPRVLVKRGDLVEGLGIGSMVGFESAIHGSGFAGTGCGLGTGRGFITGRTDGAGPFRALAVSGTAVPQVGTGVTILAEGCISLSGLNRAVYTATLAGAGVSSGNDMALFTEGPGDSGSATLIAREGVNAPGLPAGVTMRAFDRFGSWPTDLAINNRRQTMLLAGLHGTGVTTANDYAVWAADSAGQMQLLMREGSPLTIAPGDTRTVATILARRRGSSSPSMGWLNDDGEFIIDVLYSNGTRSVLVGTLDPPQCRADFNGIDGVIVQDVFDYLAAWFALAPAADFNQMGGVTLQGLFDYLAAYFGGCS